MSNRTKITYGALALILAIALFALPNLFGMGGGDQANQSNLSRTQQVIVAPAIKRTAVDFVSSVGTARANEAVIISSKVTGRLEEILFEDGQSVQEGDVLVRLDSRELQAELLSAEVTLRQADQEYERAISLSGTQAVSQSRVEELTALRDAAGARVQAQAARLEEFTIRAPFSGRVGVNRLSRGALIDPSTQITTLDDLALIKVDFAIPETEIQNVSLGTAVTATSRAVNKSAVEGRIESLETRVDPVNRTIGAVATFENKTGLLRPGMFLNLNIALQERDDAVFIAEEGLSPSGQQQFAYVVRDNVIEKRELILGLRESGLVEVLSGVEAGDLVVVRGVQFLRQGMKVEIQQQIEPGTAPNYTQS